MPGAPVGMRHVGLELPATHSQPGESRHHTANREASVITDRPTRVLFYSHDTYGLGHIRRTLAISHAVARGLKGASVLVASGSAWLPALRVPPSVDYVKLPCVTKIGDDHYQAKTLRVDFETVRSLRESILLATATAFAPDWVFVDNVPLGMKSEIVRTLRYLREHQPATRVILILRDILDEPERVVRQWTAQSMYEAIDRFYDRVLVFGAPELFDVAREYQLPATVAGKLCYAGYIRSKAPSSAVRHLRQQLAHDSEHLVLVTVGGGGDGYPVVDAYLRGLATRHRPLPIRTLVVLGPDMPDAARRNLQARSLGDARITVVDFSPDLPVYVAAVDLVVSMGGYNTVCEVLSFRKPSIIVPRVEPRLEQWIRSQRLSQLGLATAIHPTELTPERLMTEVERLLSSPRKPERRGMLNFDGLRMVTDFVRTQAS
jgi:predicted glycosyltransferase